MKTLFVLFLAYFSIYPFAGAQSLSNKEVLEQRISLNATNTNVKDFLTRLGKKANVRFSYSSTNIPVLQSISIICIDRKLGDILNELSKELDIEYSVVKQQVILTRNPSSRRSATEGVPLLINHKHQIKLEREISGRVLGENDTPLPGSSVVVKGTTIGTACNDDGYFTLKIPENAVALIVSSVGYFSKEIPITNINNLEIRLDPDTKVLQEVVATGYGSQIRQRLTSAITTVKGAELREITAAGLDQALQGRAAGVQVIRNTGAPGGGVSIRIRGTASLLGGQEPLYIIDGIPINNTPTGSADVFNTNRNGGVAGNEFVNPMSQIPIEDIESIEILKDAASASIYGARAANGVVLVTTKRGKAGKLDVSLNAYSGFGEIPGNRRYELLNGPEFAAAANLTRRLRSLPIAYPDSINVGSTDWQDEIFQQAPINNVALNVSGGNDKTKYSFSGSYFNQQGTIIGTQFNRINVRSGLDFNVSKFVKIGSNIMLSRSVGNRLRNTGNGAGTDNFNNNNLYGPSVLAAALIANPIFNSYGTDGRYQLDTLNNNISPVASAKEIKLENTDYRFIGNVFAEFEILRGLKFRTNFGSDVRGSDENYFTPLLGGVYGGAATGATLENGFYRENLWLTENYLTYNLNADKHALDLLAGFSAQESKNNGMSIRVRNIPSNELRIISAGPQQLALREQGYQYWGIASQFGRINYAFANKFLLSATLRRDGSSRFGPDKRYGIFPSASIGWVASEESFIKNIKPISFLKLRGSYGVTGNDQVGDVWTWRASIRPLENAVGGYLGASGARPVSIQVGNFSWEQTKQTDIGLELGLFKDRLFLNVDYYNRLTEGLLYGIQLPQTTGFSTAINNLGSMENKGWEITVSSTNVNYKQFRWRTDFNISFNQNKLLSLYEGRTQDLYGASLLRVGEPISFFGLIIDGINPKTGDFLPRDLNSDGKIDDADMTIIGTPLPKHFGGFNNRFEFRGIDLGVFMTWSYGNNIMNTTRSFLEQVRIPTGSAVIANMLRDAYFQRWTTADQPANYRGFDPANAYNATSGRNNNYYLEDGSYLRIKTISLGYTLPTSWTKKWRIENARLYLNANNPFLLTNYRGYDPEVNHNNIGTNITVGYDNGTYPNARSFVFGFGIGF